MMMSNVMLSRKRPHYPDSPDDHSCEHNCGHFYILESESPQSTDEDSESVYSDELASTVRPKDTSDTSGSSEGSVTSDVEMEEYDVASIIFSEEKLMSKCDSSGSDDMLCTATAPVPMATNPCEEQDLKTDSSDMSSDSTTNSELPKSVYLECIRCKRESAPFRYCIQCFRLQKGYFPERPKWTRPRRRRAKASRPGTALADQPVTVPETDQVLSPRSKSPMEQPVSILEKGDIGISVSTVDESCAIDSRSSARTPTQELPLRSQDSVPSEDAGGGKETFFARSGEPCFMCLEKPKNGVFIHKTKVHVLCCYHCSLEVWNRTKKCPLCNRRPQNVAKLIFG